MAEGGLLIIRCPYPPHHSGNSKALRSSGPGKGTETEHITPIMSQVLQSPLPGNSTTDAPPPLSHPTFPISAWNPSPRTCQMESLPLDSDAPRISYRGADCTASRKCPLSSPLDCKLSGVGHQARVLHRWLPWPGSEPGTQSE